MEPVSTRRDWDMPAGVALGVGLIVGSALWLGEAEIVPTLLTFTGAFGTLFGFALLNRWLTLTGIGAYARFAVNVAALLAVLVGVAFTELFFAVAGNVAGAAACLSVALAGGE